MAEPLVQALDAALTSPHRSTKPTRPLSPSSLRHLALQVVYVALSIRRAFLVDSFAATVQDVKRLQRALQDVLSPTLINSSWLAFVLVDYSHQPMGDEAAGQVFLVNRTLVQQGLQYETSASSERLAIVDVSPSHGASPRLLSHAESTGLRGFLHRTLSPLLTGAPQAAQTGTSTSASIPIYRIVPAAADGPQGQADRQKAISRFQADSVLLAGWLLDYPVVYYFSPPPSSSSPNPSPGARYDVVELGAGESHRDPSQKQARSPHEKQQLVEEDWGVEPLRNNLGNQDLCLTRVVHTLPPMGKADRSEKVVMAFSFPASCAAALQASGILDRATDDSTPSAVHLRIASRIATKLQDRLEKTRSSQLARTDPSGKLLAPWLDSSSLPGSTEFAMHMSVESLPMVAL